MPRTITAAEQPAKLTVPIDYPSIQDAINHAENDDIVIVGRGTYHENITINKSITLLGAGAENTTIDGNGAEHVILVTANNVRIGGITVRGGLRGITINGVNGSAITNNRIMENRDGIFLSAYSNNNTILGNNISKNTDAGVKLGEETNQRTFNFGAQSNTIIDNDLTDNHYGIYLFQSRQNLIVGNRIAVNHENDTDEGMFAGEAYDILLLESSENKIFHNSFLDEGPYAFDPGASYAIGGQYWHESSNMWDDGYPSGGNYWSNYESQYLNAKPLNQSGIWDTPYFLADGTNVDRYPLVRPI